jgi:hypothetical protein
MLKHTLPSYLKPLPPRMTSVDIDYLFAKGALSLPSPRIRNALLRSYVEFVHPYMPLIEIHDTLRIIDEGTGEGGRISLLLFQAIMFAGTAFVDMEFLREAGYSSRKGARKAFFQKARVCTPYFCYLGDNWGVIPFFLFLLWAQTPNPRPCCARKLFYALDRKNGIHSSDSRRASGASITLLGFIAIVESC